MNQVEFVYILYRQCTNHNEKEFCSKTRPHRQEQARLLQERMSSAAGADNLPRSEIMEEINACVVDICGGCPESGVLHLDYPLYHTTYAKHEGSFKTKSILTEKRRIVYRINSRIMCNKIYYYFR